MASRAEPAGAARRDGVDRLTAQDLSMLWPDDFGWPQDIGVIAVLDGTGITDPSGWVRVEQVRRAIAGRLHLVPRLRQVVYRPRLGLGRPLWTDAPSFDLAEHVQVRPLAAPADEQQLLRACADLHRRPLDQSRPLWQLWLLPGLPAGRVGLFMKMHHVVADGVAGLALFGALLDCSPRARVAAAPEAPPWRPRPAPTARQLLADNLRWRRHSLTARAGRLRHPIAGLRRCRASWSAYRLMFATGRAPRTSLNRPIDGGRGIASCPGRLDLAKHAAHDAGAKVNDVVLAAIAGGLRELMLARGERVDGVTLKAAVPVSLHDRSAGQPTGNLDGGMMVGLPVGVPDVGRRLRLIAAETALTKANVLRPDQHAILGSVVARRALLYLMSRQRMTNVYVANVPGPAVPLYLAGARLLEIFPVVPLNGNITLGVGALSYCGQLNFTVVTDDHASGDLPVFIAGLRRALADLTPAELAEPAPSVTAGG